jgi:hypothetical protein
MGAHQSLESPLGALEKVLSSKTFAGAERSGKLLRFLVESAVNGQADQLKEYTLGTRALGRGDSFDPRIDSIARVEVSRLRGRLVLYYATEGEADPVVIVLPRGTYVPVFETRQKGSTAHELGSSPQYLALRVLVWVTAGLLLLIGGIALSPLSPWRKERSPERSLMQFEVQLKPGGFNRAAVGSDIAISPDGKLLVFGEYLEDRTMRLASRRLDQRDSVDLTGTEGARGPFFSPDSQWVAFWAGGKLRKIPAGGGSPITLCDAVNLLGGSWGDDGNIIAALDSSGRLWRVSSNGGTPKPIFDLTAESLVPRWPQVLPGASAVVYVRLS